MRLSVNDVLQNVQEHVRHSRFAEAELLVRQVLRALPGSSAALIALAQILKETGRLDEAVQTYELIIAHHPGNCLAFTLRGLTLLRQHWGNPLAPRPRKKRPHISCSTLGTKGRFGNQLLQYAASRLYAQCHQLEAEFPDWIGRDLFDLDDPFITEPLPAVSEEQADILGGLTDPLSASLAGRDFVGYFQRDTTHYAQWRAEFIALFRPGRRLAAATESWRKSLQLDDGRTLVAAHLRRGDFGSGPYWLAPEEWYLNWLGSVWPSLDRPILYVATDDPAVLPAFRPYNPITAQDLGNAVPGAEFFCDFHILTLANQLAISNSSFSFVAAMLNEKGARFYRPEKKARRLIPFDPWASPVLLHDPS